MMDLDPCKFANSIGGKIDSVWVKFLVFDHGFVAYVEWVVTFLHVFSLVIVWQLIVTLFAKAVYH